MISRWIYTFALATLTCVCYCNNASALIIRERLDGLDLLDDTEYTSTLILNTVTDIGTYSFDGQIGANYFEGDFSATGTGTNYDVVHANGTTTYSFTLSLDPNTFSGVFLDFATFVFNQDIAPFVPDPMFSVTVPGNPATYSVCRNCVRHLGNFIDESDFYDRISIDAPLLPISLPASLPLFATALLAFGAASRRVRRNAKAATQA